jgi:hypothetical protein
LTAAAVGRYFQKEKVYNKFNFKERHIDTTRLAVFTAKEKVYFFLKK